MTGGKEPDMHNSYILQAVMATAKNFLRPTDMNAFVLSGYVVFVAIILFVATFCKPGRTLAEACRLFKDGA